MPFGIATPEYFQEHNDQGELTLHNLLGRYLLHAVYIVVGFYGAFASKLLPKNIKTKHKEIVNLFVPDSSLYFYFLPTFVFYLYIDYISLIFYKFLAANTMFGYSPGRFLISKYQETIEFILTLGFLGFVLINKHRQSRKLMITSK